MKDKNKKDDQTNKLPTKVSESPTETNDGTVSMLEKMKEKVDEQEALSMLKNMKEKVAKEEELGESYGDIADENK